MSDPRVTPALSSHIFLIPSPSPRLLLLPSAIAGLCFFGFSGARAEEPPPQRVVRLNLATALQRALANNFDIAIQRITTQIAGENVLQQLGHFDPVFDASLTRTEQTRRDVFVNGIRLQSGNVDRLDELSSGISGVTSWGTKYDVGYGARGQTGTAALLGGLYDSKASATLTQPLLRDAGPAVNLAGIRIARSAAKVSEWAFRQQISDVLTKTYFVYIELYFSIQQLQVDERSRDLARQLLKDNQARMDIGVKSPLDVTQARSDEATREEAVILSQRKILDNENLLKQFISRDTLAMLGTHLEIEPPPSPQFVADVRAGIADAFALRPDYRQALLDLEQQHIKVAVQKNQLLPRIDLTGSLSLLGVDSDFGSSVSRLGNRNDTGWSAGVVFSIPLGNRAARGAYNQARLAAAQSLLNIQRLEQQIVVDVDNASGQIETSRQRIATTREARRLARESLDAGSERLRAGTGTTFEVLDLQKTFSESEAAELRAVSDYDNALSQYYLKTGTSLREFHVGLE